MVKPISIGSFSGCGGSSLGYKTAGFDVRAAIEIDPIAAMVYEHNHPKTKLLKEDIRTLNGKDLLSIVGLSKGELHLWEGSPPCSKFSMAGKREKAWNKVTQTDSDTIKLRNVEDLFFDWIRLLDEMQPLTAVAENVPGLAAGAAKGKLVQFVRAIEQAGYTTQVWILHAEQFGVPQARHRLFIACVRKDLDASIMSKPKAKTGPVPYGPAIADLPTVLWENPAFGREQPSAHHAPSITSYRIYQYWKDMGKAGKHEKRFSMSRPSMNKPCPTITSYDGNVAASGLCHPHEPRRFSVAEIRRMFGYPDTFEFPVSYKDAVGRLGNSVPPPLAAAVGEEMLKVLKHNKAIK